MQKGKSCALYTSLTFLAVVMFVPFYLMIAISFKSSTQYVKNFWSFNFPLKVENYTKAWDIINKYILNSFFISFVSVFGIIVISALAGYAFAKYEFKGKNALFFLILAFNMIPASLMLIPMYLNVLNLGLNNNLWGVILTDIATNSIVPIMLARAFFEEIPDSIFESARMDGAAELRLVTSIVLPLSKPIISTIAIFSFFGIFNEYMWPMLVLADDSLKTIPVGLAKLSGQFGVDFGLQMAAYSIIAVPLMLLISFFMRYFVQGISAGAVKM